MRLDFEPVSIAPQYHMIPVPWNVGVDVAWERIKLGQQEGRPPFPPGTIIRAHILIMTTPAGRLIGIQA